MARTKATTKKTKSNNPDHYVQISNYQIVAKPKKVPLADSETVVNLLGDFGDGGVITIGTNHSKLIIKLTALKAPDTIMQDGYHSFSFDLANFNFSFLPKKKRKGKPISDEHKAKLIAGKAGK